MATYNPNKVNFVWGGVTARAYADGDMINWDLNNDTVNTTQGAKGKGAFVIVGNTDGTVTVRLQDTSPTKGAWMRLYEAQELTGVGYPALLVDRSKDINGTRKEFASTTEAMLARKPAMVKNSSEQSVAEFVFKFTECNIFHDGSGS